MRRERRVIRASAGCEQREQTGEGRSRRANGLLRGRVVSGLSVAKSWNEVRMAGDVFRLCGASRLGKRDINGTPDRLFALCKNAKFRPTFFFVAGYVVRRRERDANGCAERRRGRCFLSAVVRRPRITKRQEQKPR